MAGNSKFADYVTQTAFHMTLSRNMIGAMVRIENDKIGEADKRWTSNGADQFLMGYRALAERGLVEHSGSQPYKDGNHYRFTKAGELTFCLMVEAGLVERAEKRKKKAA